MTSSNLLLSYIAPVLVLIAVPCWFVAVYSFIRLYFAVRHLRRSTGLRWAPWPAAQPSLSQLIDWVRTLPPSCKLHVRRACISGGLFVCLVLLAAAAASIAGPLRLHR